MKRSSALTERSVGSALVLFSLLTVGLNLFVAPAARAVVVCIREVCPTDVVREVATFDDIHYGTEDTPHLEAPAPADDEDGGEDAAGPGDGSEAAAADGDAQEQEPGAGNDDSGADQSDAGADDSDSAGGQSDDAHGGGGAGQQADDDE